MGGITHQGSDMQMIANNELVQAHIWGEGGIKQMLKDFPSDRYGKDLSLILLRFIVCPVDYLRQNLKDVGPYSKTDKSVDLMIVLEEDFFKKSIASQKTYLAESIQSKLDLLVDICKRKKLDTDINKLKMDVEKIFGK